MTWVMCVFVTGRHSHFSHVRAVRAILAIHMRFEHCYFNVMWRSLLLRVEQWQCPEQPEPCTVQ